MRQIRNLVAFLILTITLNSCAFHSGLMTGNASLNDANFAIVGFAIGSSEATKVLGFGALKSDALVLEAKRNLYENYPLQPGQALANVTVDFKREHYIIWSKLKVIVSGEIVDFKQVNNKDAQPISELLGIEKINEQAFFNIGDEVLFLEALTYEKGKIIDMSEGRLTIQYYDSRNRLKTVKLGKTRAYLSAPKNRSTEFQFSLGDIAKINVPSDVNDLVLETKDAVIIGLGLESVLLVYEDNSKVRKKLVKPYYSLKRE